VPLVVALVASLLSSAPASALDAACPLPPVEPVASPAGLDMGIFAVEAAPTGAAAVQLLEHLDHLSGGDRSRLAIHLFSHFRGDDTVPGVVEHEADVHWFADQGFRVELAVPYRVPIGDEPDPSGYVAYVESVVDRVGSRLDALMVTNEVNIDFWEGPSDGIHPGALDALLAGVPAADAAIDAHGYDVDLGFKWGYRHPSLASEQAFWSTIADEGGSAFVDALDFVGVDLYTFDFYVGDQDVADYTLQALNELRTCFLPLAGIGTSTPLRITESGAPTAMWGEAGQAEAIEQTVTTAHAYSGTLNVESWRQWGLYCGPPTSGPTAIFDCTGLLRPDGTHRPSYGLLTELIAGAGAFSRPPPVGTVTTYTDPTISSPHDITVGADGNLWFTNATAASIGRITPRGYVSSFSSPGVVAPRGIMLGPDGNVWFVHAGVGGSVARATPSGAITNFPVGVNALRDITLGPDGALWFTGGDDVVGRITTDGVITRFSSGTAPDGIVAGADGALWFTRRGVIDAAVGIADGGLSRITTAGAVSDVVTDVSGSGIGGRGVAMTDDGQVWFARRARASVAGRPPNAVQGVSVLGDTIAVVAADDPPQAVAAGPDGTVWSTTVGSSIVRVEPDGNATVFASEGIDGERHEGIIEGPDGAMWFTNTDTNSIGRIVAAEGRSITYTARYTEHQCTGFARVAPDFGTTVSGVAAIGVIVAVLVAQAGNAPAYTPPAEPDGPCAVTVTVPVQHAAVIATAADSWGLTPQQLVALGAPLVTAIIYALAHGAT
jgi:virginiamycin B lyase